MIERNDWPAWLFWLILVGMLGAAVLNTSVRLIRNERMSSPGPELAG